MSDQFTRRDVNRALLSGAMALAMKGPAFRPRVSVTLFDFAIAGGWFHGLKDVRDDLSVGERLTLRAEPENPHDPHAVAVHLRGGGRLGYVPRAANEAVALLLRKDAPIEAGIVGHLDIRRAADIPDDLVFTGFTAGDPRVRLVLRRGMEPG